MNRLYPPAPLLLVLVALTSCNGQTRTDDRSMAAATASRGAVADRCEGCELLYAGMPSDIGSIDTSEGWKEQGEKLLVRGTVYRPDGTTPAPGVIIYYYHTDRHGYYSPRDGMDERAKPHGYLRGWVKSDADGRYAIYTLRPAPYPNENAPAHIHVFIKEPDLDNEYFIDELVFDDDSLVTDAMRNRYEKRGGSGVLEVSWSNDMQVAEHDIVLGLNVPGYPGK